MSLFSWLAGLGRSPPREWVDIASPQFKTNPYSFYARLRAEAPVYRLKLATREMVWLATRYDGMRAKLATPPLTAVDIHLDQVAAAAVDLLLARLGQENSEPSAIAPPRLVLRNSSGGTPETS